jgi:hypothetical protein
MNYWEIEANGRKKYFCKCGEGFRQKVNYDKHLKTCEKAKEKR